MNKSIIFIGSVLIIVNLTIGLIVSAYSGFNIAISTFILAITTLILFAVNKRMSLKDGFKVSLNLIIPLIGVIEYLLAVFMPSEFTDNWCMVLVIILLVIEAVLLVTAHSVSTKIK